MTSTLRIGVRIAFGVAWILFAGEELGGGLAAAQAATKTFFGVNFGVWSDPANWGDGVPQDGDDVVFPVAGAIYSINDMSGLELRSLRFNRSHSIDGNALALSDGVMALATVQIDAPVTLIGDQVWYSTSGMVIAQLATGGHTLTLAGDVSSNFQFLALSGGGAIVKNGLGWLQPGSAATFTGSFTVNSGILSIQTADGLGTSDGSPATATVINDGATLNIVGGLGVAEAITLNGNGHGILGALHVDSSISATFTGAITLATTASISGDNAGYSAWLSFAGPIDGPGDLLVLDTSQINLASAQNTFAGRVKFTGSADGTVMLGVAQSLAQTGGIDLSVYATLDLYGHSHTLPWLDGAGTVTSSNGLAALTIANQTDATFTGSIGNVASVVKQGAGVLTLGGDNTHNGLTSVQGGTLRVTSASAFGTSSAGTVISGEGRLVLDGVSPGNEPFTLQSFVPTNMPTLHVTATAPVVIGGSLTVSAGADAVISGATGANLTVNGQIVSAGDLRMSGVTLHATNSVNQFQAGTVTVDSDAVFDVAAQGAFGMTPTKALHVAGVVSTNGPSIVVNSLTGIGTLATGGSAYVEVAPAGTNVFPGVITGEPTFVKSAAGTLRLTGTAALGWATVDGGELTIASQQITSAHLIVNPGATLAWDVPMTHAGNLTTSDTGSGSGSSTIAIRGGNVTLSGISSFMNSSSYAHVTGPHQLLLRGTIGGRSLIAYGTGVTILDATTNFLQQIAAGLDETPAGTGTIRLARSNVLDHSGGLQPTMVGVDAGSTFDLAGFSQRLVVAAGTGRIDTGGASGVLTLDGSSGVFEGILAGAGRVVANVAPATYPLKGTQPLTGAFETNATLDVAANTVMSAPVIARGNVVTIESGSSLGSLTLEGAAEYLRAGSETSVTSITTGDLSLPAAATTKVWLTGTTPRITVNGAVHLAGALIYSTSATLPLPAPGNGAAAALTLVDNDGSDAVVGTFANYAEGSRLTINGAQYQLSYAGGTGNDVTLTPAAEDPEPTLMTYHLAEGATGTFFDTDLLIANPTSDGVLVDVTFLPESGAPIVEQHFVYAMSRLTLKLDDVTGLENGSFSTIVKPREDVPLVVERTMRWDASGYGGHTEKATSGPAPTWYFAEGAEGFFRTFLLLANPQTTANVAHVQFLREGLPALTRSYDLLPSSRRTIAAGDDEDLIDQAFGMTVTFDQPGVAERAMYFGTSPIFRGGHESAGVTAPSATWLLAEGATGAGFETFILVANPGSEAADVTFTLLPENGAPASITRTVGAASRITINPEGDPELAGLPLGPLATQITATKPVIAERAQYWPLGPADWTEAHNSFGVTDAAVKWGLAEGRAGGAEGYQTYILLANPGTSDATVTLTFLGERGAATTAPAAKTVTVPAQRRVNVAVDPTGAAGDPATTFGTLITSDQPIVVERAMYWNVNGEVWAAGTNATATRLP